jgi:hypothetical protein
MEFIKMTEKSWDELYEKYPDCISKTFKIGLDNADNYGIMK